MGVSKGLIDKAFAIVELVNLLIGEMTAYRLLTDTGGSETLTSPKICGSYPLPANCARRPGNGVLMQGADLRRLALLGGILIRATFGAENSIH